MSAESFFYGEHVEGTFVAAQFVSKVMFNPEANQIVKIMQVINPHAGYWRYYTCAIVFDKKGENMIDQLFVEGADSFSEAQTHFASAKNEAESQGFTEDLADKDQFSSLVTPFQISKAKFAEKTEANWFSQFMTKDAFDWCNEMSSASATLNVERLSNTYDGERRTWNKEAKKRREEQERLEQERKAQEARFSCGGGKWGTW